MKIVLEGKTAQIFPHLQSGEDVRPDTACFSTVIGSGKVFQYIPTGTVDGERISDEQLALHHILQYAYGHKIGELE